MKKIYSLIRATMTSDMKLFKIKTKKGSKAIPLVIAVYLMFWVWAGANGMFEKLTPMHLQHILLSVFVFAISIMTIVEGVYKTGSLIFNCKDDELLLSLPIKKRTILFIRVFKFYVFELFFNSLFLLPVMIAYIRWADNLEWTYFLTSIIMLITLPIIPIIISCIIGIITTSFASRFKYKNLTQTVLSIIALLGIFYLSYNLDNFIEYLTKHVTSISDLIIKIYYPAGIYAKLVTNFNIVDLLVFIFINITIFIIAILLLSKIYFKINSRLKKVIVNKKVKIDKLNIKAKSQSISLVKKELNTFFKTPVFIINAGFALVLFMVITIIILLKYDSFINIITTAKGVNLSKELITNNLSILILFLILFTSYMTSITNSVISLEGRNINILKSLPIKTKTILISKIYSALVLTTPVLLMGSIMLIIKFKINIIESLLLLFLVVLIPLVSHFVGLIVNLKYPKLDAENSTEVVKQSMSSFVSVTIGMILLIINAVIIFKAIKIISSILILVIVTILYIIIDIILYIYLTCKSIKEFNKLSV